MAQTKHSLWRNYPLMARWRWVMEALRDAMHQYFVGSETGNRMFRSVVYQRAKKHFDTLPPGN